MPSVSIEVGDGGFSLLRDSWQSLVKDSATATPFQTWEWQSSWWKHYASRRSKATFLVLREGSDLVGLWPMVEKRAVWRTLQPMGIGPSDYLHPLIRTGYEEQATVLFASILADQSQEKLVDVHQCRENNPLAQSIIEKSLAETGPAVTILEQAKCLILDLPSTFDGYLAMLGKSLRYDVKKLEKSWFQSGLASIETANVENIDVAMTIFFDQHRRRWHGKGLPGAFLGRGVAFQREWTHLAALNGWMQLSTLRLDGQPIGSIYAMVLGQRSFYYQAGFDPEHKAISPGTLLVAHTIRRSIEEGKTEFDFMRGCEAYKLRWKPQRALSNLRIVLEDGEKGRLKSKWTMTGHRIEQRVRARLEGQGLRKS